jgi:hypothetical protein
MHVPRHNIIPSRALSSNSRSKNNKEFREYCLLFLKISALVDKVVVLDRDNHVEPG